MAVIRYLSLILLLFERWQTLIWCLVSIQDERTKLIHKLNNTAEGLLQEALSAPTFNRSASASTTITHIVSNLKMAGVWPSKGFDIGGDIQDVSSNLINISRCNQGGSCVCDDLNRQLRVLQCSQEVSSQLKGLCLSCFRNGKISIAQGNCASEKAEQCTGRVINGAS